MIIFSTRQHPELFNFLSQAIHWILRVPKTSGMWSLLFISLVGTVSKPAWQQYRKVPTSKLFRQVPAYHPMTSDLVDPDNAVCQWVGELSVLCLWASKLVGLMTRGCEPHGNCTVHISYVWIMSSTALYINLTPLYGLDLSLLLKGLTLQRASCL